MTTNSKSPAFIAYTVSEYGQGEKKKAKWTAIGAAWPNHDGEGFSVQLDALPLDGKVVLRLNKPKEDNAE